MHPKQGLRAISVMFLEMLSCETAAAPKVFADYLLMLCPDVYKQLHCSLRHAKE